MGAAAAVVWLDAADECFAAEASCALKPALSVGVSVAECLAVPSADPTFERKDKHEPMRADLSADKPGSAARQLSGRHLSRSINCGLTA
jgi:hypothetical protein